MRETTTLENENATSKMSLAEIEAFALLKMEHHGLIQQGWRFEWDNAKRRFGVCKFPGTRGVKRYRTIGGRRVRHIEHITREHGVIGLSRVLLAINSDFQAKDTILHEIAHALAGKGHGHDAVWRGICRMIGATPKACVEASESVLPEGCWKATCEGCGRVLYMHLKPKRDKACNTCYRKLSPFISARTRFERCKLTFVENEAFARPQPVPATSSKPSSVPEWRRAAALKAWETMRARKAQAQAA